MSVVGQQDSLKNDIETLTPLFGQLSYLLHLNDASIKILRIYANLLVR